ncbi:MAG: gamma-glutamyl-gamma-aminobutyrate hydrolase family protein [Chloroflexota bacterium]
MMKLGLLDAVPPQYNEATGKTDSECFRELFASVGATADMPDYRVSLGVFPQSLDECDAYLVTGSPCSVYDDLPWITELENFVRQCHQAKKPLVGVCFGHQLIAQALGGTVQNAEQGWLLGLYDFEVFQSKPWMTSTQTSYSLYFVNHDQVVELPPGAERLGQSPRCPNLMYTLDDHILCLQPHPEHPYPSVKIFTEELKPILTPEVYEYACTSFEAGTPDAALFGRWIWRFLTNDTNAS